MSTIIVQEFEKCKKLFSHTIENSDWHIHALLTSLPRALGTRKRKKLLWFSNGDAYENRSCFVFSLSSSHNPTFNSDRKISFPTIFHVLGKWIMLPSRFTTIAQPWTNKLNANPIRSQAYISSDLMPTRSRLCYQ